jgi:hypothetical protein
MQLFTRKAIKHENVTISFEPLEDYNTQYLQQDIINNGKGVHLYANCALINASYQSVNALITTASLSAIYSFIKGELTVVSTTEHLIKNLPSESSSYKNNLFEIPDVNLLNVGSLFDYFFNLLKYFNFIEVVDTTKFNVLTDKELIRFALENLADIGYSENLCEVFLYIVEEEIEEMNYLKELAA